MPVPIRPDKISIYFFVIRSFVRRTNFARGSFRESSLIKRAFIKTEISETGSVAIHKEHVALSNEKNKNIKITQRIHLDQISLFDFHMRSCGWECALLAGCVQTGFTVCVCVRPPDTLRVRNHLVFTGNRVVRNLYLSMSNPSCDIDVRWRSASKTTTYVPCRFFLNNKYILFIAFLSCRLRFAVELVRLKKKNSVEPPSYFSVAALFYLRNHLATTLCHIFACTDE